jgi:hypothetical protein
MKCDICGEDITFSSGHLHSLPPDEHQHLAAEMCGDFDNIITKAGFRVACIVLIDTENKEKFSQIGAKQIILSFGKGMGPGAAAELLKLIGNQANVILANATLIKEK